MQPVGPRVHLAHLPTPIEELAALGRLLGGPRLFVKRDDQTGLALGGNKTRKLERLVADAQAARATTLLTAGAAQSNHCRQTAAAAARCRLRCVLALGGGPPATAPGNLLLDALLGAELHWTGERRRGEALDEVADALRRRGERPYVVPYGGSNGVGALGYLLAMQEVLAQLAALSLRVDLMVVASSSGGTQAGLVAGAKAFGYDGRILGVSVDKGEREPERYEAQMATIGNAALARVGLPARLDAGDFEVAYDYLGGGYGVLGDAEREAIHLLARHEGLLLDPVYTGRAMAGLIDLVRRGALGDARGVLFWHTGGAPALFAYAGELRP